MQTTREEGQEMTLEEIYEAISSDDNFTRYVESDGEGGQTAFTLDLIIKAIELDGALLADYELLEIIKDISMKHTKYMEAVA